MSNFLWGQNHPIEMLADVLYVQIGIDFEIWTVCEWRDKFIFQ